MDEVEPIGLEPRLLAIFAMTLTVLSLKSEAAKIDLYTVPDNTGGVSCGWTDLKGSMGNSWW